MTLGDLEKIRREFPGVEYTLDSAHYGPTLGRQETLTIQAWDPAGWSLTALLDALTAAGASWPDGRVLVTRFGDRHAEIEGIVVMPESGERPWHLTVWTRAAVQRMEPGTITSRVEV